MGKASSAKRKRAAVRSAKRSRTNTWWYGLTAIVVIAGRVLYHTLRHVRLADVLAALHAIPTGAILVSALLVGTLYAALGTYEAIIVRFVPRKSKLVAEIFQPPKSK